MNPEEQLLIRAKAQDVDALAELARIVIRELPPMLTKFKRRPSKITEQDIEDSVQNTLMKFVENPRRVEAQNIKQFLAWAKKVATNYLLDRLKSGDLSRCQGLIIIDDEGNEAEIQVPTDSFEEDFIKADTIAWSAFVLAESLEELPSPDRQIINRFYYSQDNLDAIARDLEISKAAVKKRKERILDKLRDQLDEMGISKEDVI